MAVQKKIYMAEEFEAFTLLPENADRRFEFVNREIVNREIIEVPSNPYGIQPDSARSGG